MAHKSPSTESIFDFLYLDLVKIKSLQQEPLDLYFQNLKKLYADKIGLDSLELDNKTNLYILAHFKDSLSDVDVSTIKQLINSKPYIVEKIKARNKYSFLFKQPVILFLYKLIQYLHPNDARKIYVNWLYPAYRVDLENIFVDLDVSYE